MPDRVQGQSVTSYFHSAYFSSVTIAAMVFDQTLYINQNTFWEVIQIYLILRLHSSQSILSSFKFLKTTKSKISSPQNVQTVDFQTNGQNPFESLQMA